MTNFFIIRNKEKNMYYWGDGSWTKIKDCARKYQHKDCAETLMQKDNLDYKNCEIVEIPSITDLEAKLAESEEQLIAMNEKSNKIKKESYYLKQQLTQTDKLMQEYLSKCLSLEQQLAEKEQEIEIEKKVSSWLYDIHNRTGFEQEVSEKFKTATEVTAQFQLYEYCKNQFINDLRTEVKKKLKD